MNRKERKAINERLRAEKINHDATAKYGNPVHYYFKEGWIEALEWVLDIK